MRRESEAASDPGLCVVDASEIDSWAAEHRIAPSFQRSLATWTVLA